VKVGERMMLRRGEFMTLQKFQGKETKEEGLAESTWKQMSKSMQEINPHRQQTKRICPLAFVCFLFLKEEAIHSLKHWTCWFP